MDIWMCVFGTRGDLQPMLVLAQRLRRDSHRITFFTHDVHTKALSAHGFSNVALASDPYKIVDMMVRVKNMTSIKLFVKIMPRIDEETYEQFTLMKSAIESLPRPSMILSNPQFFASESAATTLGVPILFCSGMLWTRTSDVGCVMLNQSHNWNQLTSTGHTMSKSAYNRLTYSVFETEMALSLSAPFNRGRELMGLPKTGLRGSTYSLADHPMLYSISTSLMPRPCDWSSDKQLTGEWRADTYVDDKNQVVNIADFVPSPDLEALFEGPVAPIVVGFGSMSSVSHTGVDLPSAFTSLASMLQIPVVIQRGDLGHTEVRRISNMVSEIGPAPHSWLFPKCSAAVHHGGVGTTMTALNMDTPSLLVPFFGDQYLWGKRIQEMGCGTFIDIGDCTDLMKLHRAVVDVLGPGVRARVRDVGAFMRSQNGTELATQMVYKFAKTRGVEGVASNAGTASDYCYRVIKKPQPQPQQDAI
jgi:sterol 3beta-glucosyltransferase